MSVPDYFALITRAMIVLEGIAVTGDPDFDLFRAAYPYRSPGIYILVITHLEEKRIGTIFEGKRRKRIFFFK